MQNVNKIEKELNAENDDQISNVKQQDVGRNSRHMFAVLALIVFVMIFFTVTNIGHTVLLVSVGFVYPIYKTLEVIELHDHIKKRKWYIYWLCVAVVFGFKGFLNKFVFLLPERKFMLSGLLFSIYSPFTNGYTYIYEHVIRPFIVWYYPSVKRAITPSGMDSTTNTNNN